MTPQAKALRSAVAAAVGPGKVDLVLRAVVEELGITREDAAMLQTPVRQSDLGRLRNRTADAFAALLEASGADR